MGSGGGGGVFVQPLVVFNPCSHSRRAILACPFCPQSNLSGDGVETRAGEEFLLVHFVCFVNRSCGCLPLPPLFLQTKAVGLGTDWALPAVKSAAPGRNRGRGPTHRARPKGRRRSSQPEDVPDGALQERAEQQSNGRLCFILINRRLI